MKTREPPDGAPAKPSEMLGTAVSTLLVREPRLPGFFDPDAVPMRSRIRAIVQEHGPVADELVSMATLLRAVDGGPLRTFSGNLAHENGWFASALMRRLLHFEGMAQKHLVQRLESEFEAVSVGTESIGLLFTDQRGRHRYTADVVVGWRDGTLTVFEVKRDERDLADPDLRRNLAIVAEILRRCDVEFRIIMRDEIFAGRQHRINCELFAARGYAHVADAHLRRLEAHGLETGCDTTLGTLVEALEPGRRPHGMAVLQALTVRRRVEIDLTRRLADSTPVRIH